MATLWPGRGGPALDYISGMPGALPARGARRGVVVLGSTGSIGGNALAVMEARADDFAVAGLACARNVRRLAAQALRHRPAWLAVLDADAAHALRALLPPDYRPAILTGREGYARLAALPGADMVLSAQVGAAGLTGTLAACLAGKVVCLANKESLVLAGGLVRRLCAATGASVLPVDSEHNALFQCLAGRGQEAAHLILTASGGPFRGRSPDELAGMRPDAALAHPNWKMGAKISIDSATMMNKGLELIEAVHLFGVPQERVRILVHPQSVVHSLVEFADGSLLAQLGVADMRLPIAHCLGWPACAPSGAGRLDLATASPLSFEQPDETAFPAPGLARQALAAPSGRYGISPACVALNAANEAAVELFLAGGCAFTAIAALSAAVLAAVLKADTPPGSADRPDGAPHAAPLHTAPQHDPAVRDADPESALAAGLAALRQTDPALEAALASLPEAARPPKQAGPAAAQAAPDAVDLALALAARADGLDRACRALTRHLAASAADAGGCPHTDTEQNQEPRAQTPRTSQEQMC